MTNREYDDVKDAYRNLAEAVGVKIDPEDTEPYLRNFLQKMMNLSFEKAGDRIGKLQYNVTSLMKDVKSTQKAAIEAKHVSDEYIERIRSLNRDDVLLGIEKEIEALQQEFEAKCKSIAVSYASKLNPFHAAVEDLMGQLSRHDVPKETWAEPLATLIQSMGYLQWQSNKNLPEDDTQNFISERRGCR